MDLTQQQVAILQRLRKRGFEIVAFPMYANYIGVRKGNCGALLTQIATSGFDLYGAASYLIAGNLSVRVNRDGRAWYVWKKEKLEATPPRVAELDRFSAELSDALLPTA
jgi:hypothetical protein